MPPFVWAHGWAGIAGLQGIGNFEELGSLAPQVAGHGVEHPLRGVSLAKAPGVDCAIADAVTEQGKKMSVHAWPFRKVVTT